MRTPLDKQQCRTQAQVLLDRIESARSDLRNYHNVYILAHYRAHKMRNEPDGDEEEFTTQM